jgi:hypothetical protein
MFALMQVVEQTKLLLRILPELKLANVQLEHRMRLLIMLFNVHAKEITCNL